LDGWHIEALDFDRSTTHLSGTVSDLPVGVPSPAADVTGISQSARVFPAQRDGVCARNAIDGAGTSTIAWYCQRTDQWDSNRQEKNESRAWHDTPAR